MDKQYAEKCGYHTIKEISDKLGVERSWVYKNLRRFKIKPVWSNPVKMDGSRPDLYILKEYLDAIARRQALADTVAAKCSKPTNPSPSTKTRKQAVGAGISTQDWAKSVKAPSAKFLKLNSVEKDAKAANIDRFDEEAVKRNIGLLARKGLKPVVIAHRLGLPLVDVEHYCSK